MAPNLVRELVAALEAEVNNGGFDQFFFNSTGDRTAETVVALEAIGANAVAEIARAAIAKFPQGDVPADRDARQELLEQVSPDGEAFAREDEAFYAYPDDLARLVDAYVG